MPSIEPDWTLFLFGKLGPKPGPIQTRPKKIRPDFHRCAVVAYRSVITSSGARPRGLAPR